MTVLSPALDQAFAGRSPTVFGTVLIELPNANVALLSGAGQIGIGDIHYVGRDATYGVLGTIENIADGMGDNAPAVVMTLLPSSDAAAADLASPLYQGCDVTISIGAQDPVTGAVIGTHVLMLGEIDVPTLRDGPNGRSLDIEVVSVFERFFTDDEGIRLSPDWHKSVWPGETGLDDVTGVSSPIYWGVEGPNRSIYLGGGIGSIAEGYRRPDQV
jgi:hypothetical protein